MARKRTGRIAPLFAALCLLALTVACSRGPGASPAKISPSASPSASGEANPLAVAAAQDFLSRFVRADGRVVRTDQGGDTVSEGQAYAMLLSVAANEPSTFAKAWRWARANLQRDDHLLSWHWSGGSVADEQSASDADLGVAWALVLAAERFDEPGLLAEAKKIASGIIAHETVDRDGKPVLVAGPWARAGDATVNPSYFAPQAYETLGKATGDGRWSSVADSSRLVLRELTKGSPHLPPDWAVSSDGRAVRPTGSPGGGGRPSYGWDAVRVMLWNATSCSESDHGFAAAAWPFLERGADGTLAAVYSLDGDPIDRNASAPAYVAAAAAAHAAGEEAARDMLLARAEKKEAGARTYYGSALLALGRVLLQTSLLSGCS